MKRATYFFFYYQLKSVVLWLGIEIHKIDSPGCGCYECAGFDEDDD